MTSLKNEFLMKNKKRRITIFVILFVVIISIAILSLLFGSTSISLKNVFNKETSDYIIFTKIRIPRLLGGIFAGIGLALAGCILQTLMQNDLVSPNTIGISAGSGFMVVVVISLFGNLVSFLPLAAFLGAFLTTMIIYLISTKCGNTKYSIILAGIGISSLFQALMKLIFVFDNNSLIASNDFMIGSLAGIGIEDIIIPISLIAVASIITILLSNKLNIIALGDKMASSLGVNVKAYRLVFIVLASILSSAVISYAGLIGFVGLIVPHISKRVIGSNHKLLLPFSALFGAILVLGCDLLTKLIFNPYEIPCGILISIFGVPFFLYLLLRRKHYDRD